MGNLKQRNKDNFPREKLQRLGAAALADFELVAILLGSGNSKADVFTLAKRVVSKIDKNNLELSFDDLLHIEGLGPAKCSLIIAAFELVKRRIAGEEVRITKTTDIIPLIRHLTDRKQETFICTTLNLSLIHI